MTHKFILEVILSTITFIVAHVAYRILSYFYKYFMAQMSPLLKLHIKDGHNARFKYCNEDQCSTGTAESQLLLVIQQDR
jgi:hypothetical protein